jgi:hypothetical protein
MDLETASPSPASPPDTEQGTPVAAPVQGVFRERFETLLPRIQKEWPDVARHTLEATRGSFDHVVEVISRQSGTTAAGVRQQLTDLLHVATESACVTVIAAASVARMVSANKAVALAE